MKSIFALLVIAFTSLTLEISYAETEQVFCPKQISCSEEGNIASCIPLDGDQQYWGKMRENGRIEKGIYTFSGTTTRYQSPPPFYSGCSYHNLNLGFEKFIYLDIKDEAKYLQAYITDSNKWQIAGYDASCNSDSELCPLTRIPMLVIKNFTHLSIDGALLPYGSELWLPGPSGQIRMISYDEISNYCSNKKICMITMKGWKLGIGTFDIGSVALDMENKMKILKIDVIPSTGYQIKQLDGLNTIEVINNITPSPQ